MQQTDVYYFLCDEFKITKKIRLIELFAGVGSQAMALRNIGADFEHYKVVEFDKYAIKSYNAIHGTDFEQLDITQIHAEDLEIVETDRFDYIMTYSFPCQDLSIAGKGLGMEKGSGTRSCLLWEVERLLNECQELPKVLLMENVTQVHSMKNIEDFKRWIEFLEKKGYSNYYEDLNAKNYGIPQNRNRCFMVSILGEYKFEFPNPIELDLRLKDMLEDEVDEKYCLTEKQMTKGYFGNAIDDTLKDIYDRKKALINKEIAYTITVKPDRRVGDSNYISNGFGEISVGEWLEKYNESKESECKVERLFNIYGKDKGTGFAGNSIVVNVLEAIFKQMS